MNIEDLKEEEMEWEAVPILGLALRMRIYHDSEGNMIRPMEYYQVGVHIPTGKFLIVPEGLLLQLIKQKAFNSVLNNSLKENGRLN